MKSGPQFVTGTNPARTVFNGPLFATGVAATLAADGVAAPVARAALLGAALLAAAFGRAEGARVAVGVPPHAASSNVAAPADIPTSNCRRVSVIGHPPHLVEREGGPR